MKADGVVVTDIDLDQFKEKAKKVREKYIGQNELIKQFADQVKEKVK